MRALFYGTEAVLSALGPVAAERVKRFQRHLVDLRDYIVSNRHALTNYSHAQRHGLRISSAPAESGMNHLVNQRMGKR